MTVARSVDHSIDRHHSNRPDKEDQRPRRPVVFVLEDDQATLALLCGIAEDAGWQPRGFSRVAELRAGVARERPQLLILDDSVPDGSGGDLARELRTNPATEQIPVLVCTAAHPMRRAEIGGWAPVVAKPFKLEQIEGFLHTINRRRDRFHRAAG